jgi:putative addiction module CopG family antidote
LRYPETMSVTLPRQLEELIEHQVRSGLYRDATEVIQAGLEALQREHDLAAQLDDELEKGFADFEAGRFKRFDSVDDLRSEVESRLKARAATPKQ